MIVDLRSACSFALGAEYAEFATRHTIRLRLATGDSKTAFGIRDLPPCRFRPNGTVHDYLHTISA
jgi:hypothetical protein